MKQQKSKLFELRIKNTKKGQQKMVAGLILALFVILFYVHFSIKAKEKGELILGDQQCIESVRAAAAASIMGRVKLSTSDFQARILCPPKDTKIKEDLDTEKGKEKAFEQIGLDMARCWKNYGKGKLPLFDQEGIFCGICSWIEFTDKDKEFSGLTSYLATTPMPLKTLQYEGIKGGISFADYIANYEHPTFKEVYNNPKKFYDREQIGKKDVPILTSGDTPQYAITFLYLRGEDAWETFLERGGLTPVTGSVAVGVVGAGAVGGAVGVGALFFFTGGVAAVIAGVIAGVVGVV